MDPRWIRMPPEHAEEARRLIWEEGLTQEEAQKRLGYSGRVFHRSMREYGIPQRRTGPKNGPGHPDWKGGRTVDKHGYVLLYCPDHPHARKCGRKRPCYVAEHRLVMEKHLGRYLERHEVVHHLNGVRSDNRIENLELYQSNSDHLRDELTGRCPNWTPAGRERILAGVRKGVERSRRSPRRGGWETRRRNARLKDGSGESPRDPSDTACSPG